LGLALAELPSVELAQGLLVSPIRNAQAGQTVVDCVAREAPELVCLARAAQQA
jgi:hypothetical protein